MNIQELVKESCAIAKEKGWDDEARTFGDIIALIHSEASEALEDFRNRHGTDEVFWVTDKDNRQKPCGIPIEFADIVIRIAHACGKYGIDLEQALFIKLAYNKSRPYRHGGKAL